MKVKIIETKDSKVLKSESYNFVFNKKTGMFARWGKTQDDDPIMGMPEIADIEITTSCSGPDGKVCPFCYKGNTPKGVNMSIDTYRKILDKLHFNVIIIELDNGNIINLNENDYINTQRGLIKAKELVHSDEIIET